MNRSILASSSAASTSSRTAEGTRTAPERSPIAAPRRSTSFRRRSTTRCFGLLAWRPCDDLDAAIKNVATPRREQCRLDLRRTVYGTARESDLAPTRAFRKTCGGYRVDLVDDSLQRVLRAGEILVLCREGFVACFKFLKLGKRIEIDVANILNLPPQLPRFRRRPLLGGATPPASAHAPDRPTRWHSHRVVVRKDCLAAIESRWRQVPCHARLFEPTDAPLASAAFRRRFQAAPGDTPRDYRIFAIDSRASDSLARYKCANSDSALRMAESAWRFLSWHVSSWPRCSWIERSRSSWSFSKRCF